MLYRKESKVFLSIHILSIQNPLPETGRGGCNQGFFSLRLQNDTQGVIPNDVKNLF